MTIRDMETRYRELREKFITGAINREIFEAQVAQLRYQDDQGRYWAIGLQEGFWHVFENGRWRRGKPIPPADPRCAYCGQLLPPGSDRCGLCGKRIPPPPPPPLVTVSSAPELPSLTPEVEEKRKTSWLRMGIVAAVTLVVFVCLSSLGFAIMVLTRTTGLPAIAVSGSPPGNSATATVAEATPTQPASPTRPVPTPTRTRGTSPTAMSVPSATPAVQTPSATPTTTPVRATSTATATPRRATQPRPTATTAAGTGFRYQQDGKVELGAGDCKGTAMVWGYVNDVNWQPIDGAYLFVWFEGADWGRAPQVARTDIKGVYRLQLLTGQKGTYRVMVIKGWQDRTPLSPPSEAIVVNDYCQHSSFRLNWRQTVADTPTPTQPPPPTVVSDYAFMLSGDIRLSEPKCGRLFKVQGRISGLNEFAGKITIKVRSPDDVVQNFPEAIQPDGTYILPTLPTYYTGDYLIWLEDKVTRERLSDHVQFSGADPCLGSIFEINWKRRK